MKRKTVWVLVSSLMVFSLVLASCGQAAPEEEEEVIVPQEEEEVIVPQEEEEEVPIVEVPKHGGIINLGTGNIVKSPNPVQAGAFHMIYVNSFVCELLGVGDWSRGLGGTGEINFMHSSYKYPFRGALAESWEQLDPYTIIFHIRQGVRWHDKPPVSGRELTAQDVVDCMKNYWSHTEINPGVKGAWIDSITATDKYTIEVKANTVDSRILQLFMVGDTLWINPVEMQEYYGEGFTTVDGVCGTGPFVLTDFVSGSSITLERNRNYWGYDELNPEQQLPYADGIRIAMIPDKSTQMSALRTGKIDQLSDLTLDDAESLKMTSPELKQAKYLRPRMPRVDMRADIEPYSDIRVRKALNMAIDREAIVNDYFKGEAEVFAYPLMPNWETFMPLEEYPESIRENYEYNPEKAKQLLAEAGYPDGFNTECITLQPVVEKLQILIAYWRAIGVDCEIKVVESVAWRNMVSSKSFPQMNFGDTTAPNPIDGLEWKTSTSMFNSEIHIDPDFDAAFATLKQTLDETEQNKMIQELTKQYLAACPHVMFPADYLYTFWWPWLNSYHGEPSLGMHHLGGLWTRVWVDQELKKEMGY